MHEALVYTSPLGPFKKIITAFHVKSREHYRELFPLISVDSSEPVTWVKGTFENGELKRRSHFRTLSGKRQADFIDYKNYTRHKEKIVQSPEHVKATNLLRDALSLKLETTKTLNWSFKDDDISDFYFKGNVLFNAKSVCKEHRIQTCFNKEFRLDVAATGDVLSGEPLVVFGVEIERGHRFNGLKTILCKTLGFPFISIDITEMTLDEITPEWAESALSLTTRDNKMGFRKSFVYIPPLLYPFYIRHDGRDLGISSRHSYVVFASKHHLEIIRYELEELRKATGHSLSEICVSLVNGEKSKEALHQVELERKVVGQGWEQLANNQFIRISLPRPIPGCGVNRLHYFYILMSKCLLSNNALVGYKYDLGLKSSYSKGSDELWIVHEAIQSPDGKKRAFSRRYLPRLLSSPLVEVAEKLGLL